MCKRIKGFLGSNLLTKYKFFKKLPEISHTQKHCNFERIFAKRYTNCFYPINFMAGTFKESAVSFLAVVSCDGINLVRCNWVSLGLFCGSVRYQQWSLIKNNTREVPARWIIMVMVSWVDPVFIDGVFAKFDHWNHLTVAFFCLNWK